MNIMEKFQNGIESVLVPIAAKLNSQRHICAVRDAFILSFPLTMAGSLMVLLNFVLLSPDGFIAKLLRLESFIPNLADYQSIFSPVLKGSADRPNCSYLAKVSLRACSGLRSSEKSFT